jgi:hypothetical protein
VSNKIIMIAKSTFNELPDPRITDSASDFERIMESKIEGLVKLHLKALELLQTQRGSLPPDFCNRNSNSNNMNSIIRGLAKQAFPIGFRTTENGTFYVEIEGHCRLFFKKLDNKFMPNYVKTRNSQRILNQYSLGFDQLPVIFIGYRPNITWDNLDFISAVYISGGQKIWISDLLAAASNRSITQLPIFNNNSKANLDVDVNIKPGKEKKVG